MIALRTFGGFEVSKTTDGSTRMRLAPQQSALLVYLALAKPNGQRTRDQIMAMLWPELPDARAREALNQAVFRLRELVGDDVVTREGDSIRLDQVRCDAVEFETALSEHRLEAALDLYTGDLLAGVFFSQSSEFELWVEQERERLRSRAVTTALTLAKREKENGNPVGSVTRLRQALGWAPDEEPIARDLVRLLVQLGDRASAVRVFDGFAARLAADLSLPPPGDLEQYVRAVRAGKLMPASSASSAPASGPVVREEPVVPVRRASRPLLVALPLVGLIVAGASFLLLAKDRNPAGTAEPPISRRTAVAQFDNMTGDTAQAILGTLAADRITEGLSRTGLAEVFSTTTAASTLRGRRVQTSSESGGVLRTLIRETGARILVSGVYFTVLDSLRFEVRISDALTGALLSGVVEAAGPADNPEPVIELLRQRTLGALAPLFDERLASWARVASRPSSFEAYQLYAAGLDRPLGSRSTAEREEYFLKAAALDSTFTAPLVWALTLATTAGHEARAESLVQVLEPRRAGLPPWDRSMLDFGIAAFRGNFPEAYAAMRRIVELAPHSEWELELAFWALWINRPREAIERLRRLDPERRLRPYAPRRHWFTLLAARHLLGDFEGILLDVARMRQDQVEPSLASAHELAALAALGRVAQVKALSEALLASDDRPAGPSVLDAAMELRAHGYAEAAEQLIQRLVRWYAALPPAELSYVQEMQWADALFAAGRIAEARPRFERMIAEDTLRWTPRGYLGQIAAREGERATAERELRYQLSQAGKWAGGEAVIHAAAIAAELGDTARAVQLARLAISRGFYYTHPSVHIQARLEMLWHIPAARALLRPAG